MGNSRSRNGHRTAWIGIIVAVLVLFEIASFTVLFSRMSVYSNTSDFLNVMPLCETSQKDGVLYAPNIKYAGTDGSGILAATPAVTESEDTSPAGTETGKDTADTNPPSADTSDAAGEQNSGVQSSGGNQAAHPEFRMTAEAEIFRFTYDETGRLTVISNNGGGDKLIAPGTSNRYRFTLENPGDVALDYNLTMEAYVTGTDLRLPVNVSMWDYKNKYIVGSADEKADVLELNTVNETAELGAGRYASYTLEWEWPFEWGNDEYDTLIGNLAADDDIELTIIIRTVAEYDEEPDDPSAGIPPKTGDDSYTAYLAAVCAVSFIAICLLLFVGGRRKNVSGGER